MHNERDYVVLKIPVHGGHIGEIPVDIDQYLWTRKLISGIRKTAMRNESEWVIRSPVAYDEVCNRIKGYSYRIVIR